MPKGHPGERNCKAKLSAEDVRLIRLSSERQGDLATRYNVSPDTIHNIRSRKTWRHLADEGGPPRPSAELEEWRPVTLAPFAGRYAVSDLGRVRVVRGAHLPQPIRRLIRNAMGYTTVVLTAQGRQQRVPVHRLVAMEFLGPRQPGHHVNHKNGDKEDARLSNLEYVTPRENVLHAIRVGLRPAGPPPRKPRHPKPSSTSMII
jgi:hypothetical protein